MVDVKGDMGDPQELLKESWSSWEMATNDRWVWTGEIVDGAREPVYVLENGPIFKYHVLVDYNSSNPPCSNLCIFGMLQIGG